ncbi:hypothetical protein FEK30_05935 [Picosynechococcus sp. PCC 11901]|uniref:hypothetical protein n=1 Tax=Picosynechococcus sp. PCC 11901 TaxID=2579791 RepID=UPI0010FC3242|nr:hypothetical protein [Picosynechococcus sp. PCC 11901]QCS49012.1 hypothetical protein FEK30_05935 [Picosynechococcus sp. PCC 11901]
MTAKSPVPLPSVASEQIVIAQTGYVEDPDILGQIRDGFQNFVDSGQMWALILGFVLGYWFSGIRRG